MEKQYVRSERAHFMCPNMHFGIKIELTDVFNEQRIYDTLQKLSTAHPFLRCVIAQEGGMNTLFYKDTGVSKTEISVFPDESTLWEDYKRIAETDWNIFEEGMLKLYVYPKAEGMTLLFTAHHLLTDGRGLLELSQTFAESYRTGAEPVCVQERLIRSVGELPEKSGLSGISRLLVKYANRHWKRENREIGYDAYRAFAVDYGKKHPVDYATYAVEKAELSEMLQKCRANGISLNDLLMAEMYVRTGAEKIIIAVDIRSRITDHVQGSLGNYSTAMGIAYKARTTDALSEAKEVRKLVQRNMNNPRALMLVLACYFEMDPTLLDAAAISALGGFESRAAQLVGGGMFGMASPRSHSITNLGRVENENIDSLLFIPPASPAAKFTLGVVTLNGVLRACSSKNLCS